MLKPVLNQMTLFWLFSILLLESTEQINTALFSNLSNNVIIVVVYMVLSMYMVLYTEGKACLQGFPISVSICGRQKARENLRNKQPNS